jgi:LuxR family maltose regulon positive regulatory protein
VLADATTLRIILTDRADRSPTPPIVEAPDVAGAPVVRHAAIASLRANAALGCQVVRAPAGYGKTTLLRQWSTVDGRPVAWLTVDRSHDEPSILVEAVAAAIGSARAITAPPRGAPPRSARTPDALLAALGARLAEPGGDTVVVIDDVHVLTGRTTIEALSRLIDLIPTGSQLVLSGRRVPAVHLSRRVLVGGLHLLGTEDLAFSESEAAVFLSRSLPDLGPDSAAELLEHIGGWPAGLSLAAMALRDRADTTVRLAELTGDRHLIDYFREEVLAQLPADHARLLLSTAILDRFDGPLCDAVTDGDHSAAVLRDLAESWGVVVAEGPPGWYRHHPLFEQLARQELRDASGEDVATLHRRAASWCSTHDRPDAAVTHAVASGDLDLAADVVYRHLFDAIIQGHLTSVDRWLAQFRPEEVRRRLRLSLAAGWLAVARGDLHDAERWIELCATFPEEPDLPDGTVDTSVSRAAMEMLSARGGVDRTIELATAVLAAGRDGSPWWAMARLLLAVATMVAGRDDDPVATFDAVEFDLRGAGAPHCVALAQLALVQLQSQDAAGHDTVRAALDELEELQLLDYALTTMVHCAHAFSAAVRGAVEQSRLADRQATRLLESMNRSIPRGILHQRLVLADAACRRGEFAVAAEHLRAAQDVQHCEPDAEVLHDWYDRLDRRVRLVIDPDAGTGAGLGVTAAEMRVLEMLPTHHSLGAIGTELFVSRNTVKSHTIAIYRKLGVSGRGAAVDRARELGLLEA